MMGGDQACVLANRFAKYFTTDRSDCTNSEISREISRNNLQPSKRVSGVFSMMAASMKDAILMNHHLFYSVIYR